MRFVGRSRPAREYSTWTVTLSEYAELGPSRVRIRRPGARKPSRRRGKSAEDSPTAALSSDAFEAFVRELQGLDRDVAGVRVEVRAVQLARPPIVEVPADLFL